jgi:hypothetical protein
VVVVIVERVVVVGEVIKVASPTFYNLYNLL